MPANALVDYENETCAKHFRAGCEAGVSCIVTVLLAGECLALANQAQPPRRTLSLNGPWQFQRASHPPTTGRR